MIAWWEWMEVVYYRSRFDFQCMLRPQEMRFVKNQVIKDSKTVQKFCNTDDRDLVNDTDASHVYVANITDALRGRLSEEAASLAAMKVFHERKLLVVFLERTCSR